jgi:hypothetical protein
MSQTRETLSSAAHKDSKESDHDDQRMISAIQNHKRDFEGLKSHFEVINSIFDRS